MGDYEEEYKALRNLWLAFFRLPVAGAASSEDQQAYEQAAKRFVETYKNNRNSS
jgi:hypothetical protein